MTKKPKLSPDQKKALKDILKHPHVFLTGKAGTGKTFLIEQLKSQCKNVAVTATTGIAAQLIKGQTIHSFCGIIPKVGVIDSRKANIRIRACQILVVDEISMANVELIDQIFKRFEIAEHEPKVLFSGDFCQLPPVEGGFAFESPHWSKFHKVCLTTIHRQTDLNFIESLNDLRKGLMTDKVSQLIKDRTVDQLPDDCIKLFPRRFQAEDLNNQKLGELPSKLKASEWSWDYVGNEGEDNPNFEPKEPNEANTRFPKRLFMKEGARVCLLTNTDFWVNGSTGYIRKICESDVEVVLDRGGVVHVGDAEEVIYGAYGNPLYRIKQLPMMLAWALTIHRAQGMSLDKVGVYLNGHFACGQTYVSISRAKTKEGLFLQGNLERVSANQKALEFTEV